MLRWLEVEMKLKSAKETNRKLGHSFMKVRTIHRKMQSKDLKKFFFSENVTFLLIDLLCVFCFIFHSNTDRSILRHFHLSPWYPSINCMLYNLIETHIQIQCKRSCSTACLHEILCSWLLYLRIYQNCVLKLLFSCVLIVLKKSI